MTLFRQALLKHLVARHAISEELKVPFFTSQIATSQTRQLAYWFRLAARASRLTAPIR